MNVTDIPLAIILDVLHRSTNMEEAAKTLTVRTEDLEDRLKLYQKEISPHEERTISFAEWQRIPIETIYYLEQEKEANSAGVSQMPLLTVTSAIPLALPEIAKLHVVITESKDRGDASARLGIHYTTLLRHLGEYSIGGEKLTYELFKKLPHERLGNIVKLRVPKDSHPYEPDKGSLLIPVSLSEITNLHVIITESSNRDEAAARLDMGSYKTLQRQLAAYAIDGEKLTYKLFKILPKERLIDIVKLSVPKKRDRDPTTCDKAIRKRVFHPHAASHGALGTEGGVLPLSDDGRSHTDLADTIEVESDLTFLIPSPTQLTEPGISGRGRASSLPPVASSLSQQGIFAEKKRASYLAGTRPTFEAATDEAYADEAYIDSLLADLDPLNLTPEQAADLDGMLMSFVPLIGL